MAGTVNLNVLMLVSWYRKKCLLEDYAFAPRTDNSKLVEDYYS